MDTVCEICATAKRGSFAKGRHGTRLVSFRACVGVAGATLAVIHRDLATNATRAIARQAMLNLGKLFDFRRSSYVWHGQGAREVFPIGSE